MKAAVIPPIPELPKFGCGDFHLLLTHLMDDPRYRHHYLRERDKGAYLVLDNSAHEKGEGEDPGKLLQLAMEMRAQEVVVPDALFDADRTVECAVAAHEAWFEAGVGDMIALNPALMYVPQGKDIYDWAACAEQLTGIHMHAVKKYDIKRNYVLGISKDYEVWDGGLIRLIREEVVPLLLRNQKKFGITPNVHMLGWGRQLWALGEIARAHPWIRSIDSAKPYVYALKEIMLNPDEDPPKYPKRPKGYFSRRFKKEQDECAILNTVLFRSLADGGESWQ